MSSVYVQLENHLQTSEFTGIIDSSTNTRRQYATDESIFYIEPKLVIVPKNIQDITQAVQAVHKYSNTAKPLHITPRAAGTGLSGGSLNDSVILDTLKHFTAIHKEESNKEGIVYECDPGVLYRDLEEVMDKAGVYIPSYPASKDMCTIGGMVANNAAGADTYKYGHTAEYVRALNVILSDGEEYHIRPLEYKEFQEELQRDDALGELYRYIWELCLHHEELLLRARPKVRKNSAGYALWDVISTTVEEFVQGRGVFDATQIFSGSQGTLGIITRIWIQAIPQAQETTLITLPIRNITRAGEIIQHISHYHPINIELFDGASYKAALNHKDFFTEKMTPSDFRTFAQALRRHYNLVLKRNIPEYFFLITLPQDESPFADKLIHELKHNFKVKARIVRRQAEAEMLWSIRRASYSLSKLADPHKRPAAFLEDMTVPQEHLGNFLQGIRELFAKFNIQALVHGHGGNGHLHFYPLLDFTQANTADNITVMAQEFFTLATSLDGSICGEHNDGIIRTPYLDTMFSKEVLEIFDKLERVCDPHDIFNSGKKVRPRFKLRDVIRHTN